MNQEPGTKNQEPSSRLLLLFGIAFAMRLFLLLETRGQAFHSLTRYTVDSWYFWNLAQRLVHNGFSYPEAWFMPPGYPFFLALFSFVFDSHFVWLQLFQMALGSIGAVLVYLLGQRLFDRRVALVAFVAYLLYGNCLFLDLTFLPHALVVGGELLVIYLISDSTSRSPRISTLIITGLITGLLILIRSELLLLLPLLLVTALFWRRMLPLRNCAWILAGSALMIAPVTMHNLIAGKDPVLVSFNGGLNFYLGNNPKADGTWQPSYPLVQTGSISIETLRRNSRAPGDRLMRPSESSSYWTAQALDFIRANPVSFLKLVVRKLGLFLSNYEIPNNYYYDLVRPQSLILKLAFLPFGLSLAFGIAGMILALRTWPRSFGFYLFLVVYLVASLLIFTVSRLRAPVAPLLVVFAAYFGLELYARLAASSLAGKSRVSRLKSRVHEHQAGRADAGSGTRFWVATGAAGLIFAASFVTRADRRQYAVEGNVQAGNIYLETNRPARAKECYLRALSLKPDNQLARYGLFNAAAKLKSRIDAEKYLAELYRFSRARGDSLYALLAEAKFGTMTSDFPRAREAYQRALGIDPASTDTRFLLASVCYTLRDPAAARQQLDTLLSLNPEDAEARKLYALIQQEQK
jgi:4-amino-4-deoxy-L-arabinose transferase-like glycosyltransferase